jgi:NADH dehydrogenase/NADH:ubiquinone oxidoreductase subunit G
MIQLLINNIPVEVPEGTTILAASKNAGIRIPTLCFVEGLQASSPPVPCRSPTG